jgi:hypothetical protein
MNPASSAPRREDHGFSAPAGGGFYLPALEGKAWSPRTAKAAGRSCLDGANCFRPAYGARAIISAAPAALEQTESQRANRLARPQTNVREHFLAGERSSFLKILGRIDEPWAALKSWAAKVDRALRSSMSKVAAQPRNITNALGDRVPPLISAATIEFSQSCVGHTVMVVTAMRNVLITGTPRSGTKPCPRTRGARLHCSTRTTSS